MVVGSLFTLVISAYSIRMDLEDWQTVPIPKLLWFNTAVLVLSSVALQLALVAARRGERDGALTGLLAGGVSAVIFLVGQLLAWQQLRTAGFLVAGNPANSFFYLITGLHGLHIAGGLVALGRDHGEGVQRPRAAEAAPEHRTVRHLLALPAGGLADPARPLDRAGR